MILSGFSVVLCCALPFFLLGLLTLANPHIRDFWWDGVDEARYRVGRSPLPSDRRPERALTVFGAVMVFIGITFMLIGLTQQPITILPTP